MFHIFRSITDDLRLYRLFRARDIFAGFSRFTGQSGKKPAECRKIPGFLTWKPGLSFKNGWSCEDRDIERILKQEGYSLMGYKTYILLALQLDVSYLGS